MLHKHAASPQVSPTKLHLTPDSPAKYLLRLSPQAARKLLSTTTTIMPCGQNGTIQLVTQKETLSADPAVAHKDAAYQLAVGFADTTLQRQDVAQLLTSDTPAMLRRSKTLDCIVLDLFGTKKSLTKTEGETSLHASDVPSDHFGLLPKTIQVAILDKMGIRALTLSGVTFTRDSTPTTASEV